MTKKESGGSGAGSGKGQGGSGPQQGRPDLSHQSQKGGGAGGQTRVTRQPRTK